MGFYADFWKNFFNFSGKTNRMDFWLTVLVNVIIFVVLFFILGVTVDAGFGASAAGYFVSWTLIPFFAICLRRLRDAGLSPFVFLFNYIPIIGWIMFLTFCCLPSKSGSAN